MPGAARLGDICTGHGNWPPRTNTSASTDVFVNGQPAHRQGDEWQPHTNNKGSTHGGTTTGGSPTVFVNGRALARIGDAVSCGSSIATGSANVIIDG